MGGKVVRFEGDGDGADEEGPEVFPLLCCWFIIDGEAPLTEEDDAEELLPNGCVGCVV